MSKIIFLSFLISLTISSFSFAMSSSPPIIENCPKVFVEPSPSKKLLKTDKGRFIDKNGRVIILRGVNASGDAKVPPFDKFNAPTFLDPLPGLGLNTIRLLFIWEALEAERCHYDENYMEYYEQIVEWAAERQLYVIVDFHQDAYSRWSLGGCGDGFPKWSITREVELKEPKNDESCEAWGGKMLIDFAHHKTWGNFHKDREGAKSRFLDMQFYVASRLAKYENVIGYDIINEPWGTDTELETLFKQSGTVIRSADPDAILFFPPHALVSSGLTGSDVLRPDFENIVYSPHYYNPLVFIGKQYFGDDVGLSLNPMKYKANDWNSPLFLGEFGSTPGTANVEAYMDAVYTWLNKGFHSGTQWGYTPNWRSDIKDGWNNEDFSIVDGSGNIRANFRKRATPVAIAGKPLLFRESADFMRASWLHSPHKGKTTFYIPEGFMENKQLEIQGGAECELEQQTLSCYSHTPTEIAVTIQ